MSLSSKKMLLPARITTSHCKQSFERSIWKPPKAKIDLYFFDGKLCPCTYSFPHVGGKNPIRTIMLIIADKTIFCFRFIIQISLSGQIHRTILTIACRNSTESFGQHSTISVFAGSPSTAIKYQICALGGQ